MRSCLLPLLLFATYGCSGGGSADESSLVIDAAADAPLADASVDQEASASSQCTDDVDAWMAGGRIAPEAGAQAALSSSDPEGLSLNVSFPPEARASALTYWLAKDEPLRANVRVTAGKKIDPLQVVYFYGLIDGKRLFIDADFDPPCQGVNEGAGIGVGLNPGGEWEFPACFGSEWIPAGVHTITLFAASEGEPYLFQEVHFNVFKGTSIQTEHLGANESVLLSPRTDGPAGVFLVDDATGEELAPGTVIHRKISQLPQSLHFRARAPKPSPGCDFELADYSIVTTSNGSVWDFFGPGENPRRIHVPGENDAEFHRTIKNMWFWADEPSIDVYAIPNVGFYCERPEDGQPTVWSRPMMPIARIMADPLVEACPKASTDTCPGWGAWPSIVNAKDVDPALTFIAMDVIAAPLTILAQKDGQVIEPVVVHARGDSSQWTVTTSRLAAPASESLKPVAVTAHGGLVQGMHVTVLACGASDCSLYGTTDWSDPLLVPLPGGTIPGAPKLKGIDFDASDGSIIVYGEGAYRYRDGTWEQELDPSTQWNSISPFWVPTLAAGPGGRLMAGDGQQWSELVSGTTEDLNYVAPGHWRPIIVGNHGTVLVKPAAGGEFLPCKVGDGKLVGGGETHAGVVVIEESGRLHQGIANEDGSWCSADTVPGPVIAGQTSFCADGVNFVVLTPEGAFGEYGCPLSK